MENWLIAVYLKPTCIHHDRSETVAEMDVYDGLRKRIDTALGSPDVNMRVFASLVMDE